MCLIKVRDEEVIEVPARRVREMRRVREYSPPQIARRVSRTTIVEERRPPSVAAPPPPRSEAPSVRSHAPTHISQRYIQVDHEAESSVSSASSKEKDVRSHVSHKTAKSHKSSHTRVPSVAPSAPVAPRPMSDYSMHEREREIQREYTHHRPSAEYETYRYVNAPRSIPRSEGRRSVYDDGGDEYRRLQVSIKNNR